MNNGLPCHLIRRGNEERRAAADPHRARCVAGGEGGVEVVKRARGHEGRVTSELHVISYSTRKQGAASRLKTLLLNFIDPRG